MINGALLRHTWRGQGTRLVLVALALAAWGFLMPVIYATYGRQFEVLVESGIIPEVFLRLMGADPFSLDGVLALGVVHPFAIALLAVYPIGFGAAAVAGERQRGTLEILLARPISRRSLVVTLAVALAGFVLVATLALLGGAVAGAAAYDVAGRLDAGELAFLAANTVLLFLAFGSVSLVASTTFDRLAPAAGAAFAFVVGAYVLEILGTLWPDAEPLQPLSLFHYLQPLDVLAGRGSVADLAILAGVTVAALAHVLFWFPRRDLPAPA